MFRRMDLFECALLMPATQVLPLQFILLFTLCITYWYYSIHSPYEETSSKKLAQNKVEELVLFLMHKYSQKQISGCAITKRNATLLPFASVSICFAVQTHIGVGLNPSIVEQIQANIDEFEDRFTTLKKITRDGLGGVDKNEIVVYLTDLQADDMPSHKVFPESTLHVLSNTDDHYDIFGCLDWYWNYLAPELLEKILRAFSGEEVQTQMKTYQHDIHQFMSETPVESFCQSQMGKEQESPPPGTIVRGRRTMGWKIRS